MNVDPTGEGGLLGFVISNEVRNLSDSAVLPEDSLIASRMDFINAKVLTNSRMGLTDGVKI